MQREPGDISTSFPRAFTIHSLNNYANVYMSSISTTLNLDSDEVGTLIHMLFREAVKELAKGGVNYADLRWALTPRSSYAEIAFLFDSTRAYGFEVSKAWLPTLWNYGPKRTAISHGDILHAPSEWVWCELTKHLVRANDFPQISTEQYYVVYFTNLSSAQVIAMDAALRASMPAYLGYIDCSTWTPIKSCMLLPQYAIRDGDALIVPADEDGLPHIILPETGCNYRLVGVEQGLYGVLLEHRMDNGVPGWADDDSAIALTALGGSQGPLRALKLDIDERRFGYLTSEDKGHGVSVRRAGLDGLSREQLVKAIEAKIGSGLIYNLRFVDGTRDGKPAPENNALMFTVQVEFPDEAGKFDATKLGSSTCRPATLVKWSHFTDDATEPAPTTTENLARVSGADYEYPHMPRRVMPSEGSSLTLGDMITASVDDVVLRFAMSAYLGRYTGTSRAHSESDLRIFLAWCAERALAPLAVSRPQVELYVRWMQEVRRFKTLTVSRRMAVVTGFYRTCVIDAVLKHSPADYVRRPRVSNESPVLGLSHL